MNMPAAITHLPDLRARIAAWRDQHHTVAFVPTMGNLHAGHLHLVETAGQHADRVVVSIFVNPTQFDEADDFSRYPRTLEQDLEALADSPCDLVYTPEEPTIYPGGPTAGRTRVKAVPELADKLCGASRPGHFDGVVDVLSRLFNHVTPQLAVFGEKDYQQLLIIRRLVADLGWPLEIVAADTRRAPDGLALSSRNRYLDSHQRSQAAELHAALRWASGQLKGVSVADLQQMKAIEAQVTERLVSAGFVPDYVSIADGETLGKVGVNTRHARIFSAARLGPARLIDNLPLQLAG